MTEHSAPAAATAVGPGDRQPADRQPADRQVGQVPSEDRPGRSRKRQTATDMLRSLALVLGVVAVMVLVTFRLLPEDPVQTIELDVAVAQARQAAPFDPLVPEGLSQDWKPVNALTRGTGEDAVWRVGWVSPDEEQAALLQAERGEAGTLVRQEIGAEATEDGSADVAGRAWARWSGEEDRRSLSVTLDDGSVAVVSGTVDAEELVELARALQPVA